MYPKISKELSENTTNDGTDGDNEFDDLNQGGKTQAQNQAQGNEGQGLALTPRGNNSQGYQAIDTTEKV